MASRPARYGDAVYDNPISIYEKFWVVYTEEDDTFLSVGYFNSETDDVILSYVIRLPWGGTVSNTDKPYTEGTGSNGNPFEPSSGNYNNRRPYEED